MSVIIRMTHQNDFLRGFPYYQFGIVCVDHCGFGYTLLFLPHFEYLFVDLVVLLGETQVIKILLELFRRRWRENRLT